MPVLDVKVEVELPGANILREVSLLVCKGQPNLDRLEEVDVAPHRLVMVIRRGLERADWAGNNARKFRILLYANTRVLGQSPRGGCEVYHCDVRIFFDEIADDSHLRLEVWGPHFLYPRHRSLSELQRRRASRRGERVRGKMVVAVDQQTEIAFASAPLIHLLGRHGRRHSGHLQAQTIQTVAVLESATCRKLGHR